MKSMTTLDLSTIPFLPGAGRGIAESIDWKEHGELHDDVNGEGFVITIPGGDKMTITYTGSGDWAAPAVMHIPLLSLVDVTLIDPWYIPFQAGVGSIVLPRTPWSDEDMELFSFDKTPVPRSAWAWSGPRIVTMTPQAKRGFVGFRPKTTAFLTQKPRNRGEWTGKVDWTLAFEERSAS